jgi:hypothetical protein
MGSRIGALLKHWRVYLPPNPYWVVNRLGYSSSEYYRTIIGFKPIFLSSKEKSQNFFVIIYLLQKLFDNLSAFRHYLSKIARIYDKDTSRALNLVFDFEAGLVDPDSPFRFIATVKKPSFSACFAPLMISPLVETITVKPKVLIPDWAKGRKIKPGRYIPKECPYRPNTEYPLTETLSDEEEDSIVYVHFEAEGLIRTPPKGYAHWRWRNPYGKLLPRYFHKKDLIGKTEYEIDQLEYTNMKNYRKRPNEQYKFEPGMLPQAFIRSCGDPDKVDWKVENLSVVLDFCTRDVKSRTSRTKYKSQEILKVVSDMGYDFRPVFLKFKMENPDYFK